MYVDSTQQLKNSQGRCLHVDGQYSWAMVYRSCDSSESRQRFQYDFNSKRIKFSSPSGGKEQCAIHIGATVPGITNMMGRCCVCTITEDIYYWNTPNTYYPFDIVKVEPPPTIPQRFLIKNSVKNGCLDDDGYTLVFQTCDTLSASQQYTYDPATKLIRNPYSNKCIDDSAQSMLTLSNCDQTNVNQQYTYLFNTKEFRNLNKKTILTSSVAQDSCLDAGNFRWLSLRMCSLASDNQNQKYDFIPALEQPRLPSKCTGICPLRLQDLSSGQELIIRDNGNLELIKNQRVVWTSGTAGRGVGPYSLYVQNDGNLVLYNGNSNPIWASNKYFEVSGLTKYVLSLRSDGLYVKRFESKYGFNGLEIIESTIWRVQTSSSSIPSQFVLKVPSKNNLCVDDSNGIQLGICLDDSNGIQRSQNQLYSYDSANKFIKNVHKALCLDTGSSPVQGSKFTLSPCQIGNTGQQFDYDVNTLMFKKPNLNLCMDDGGSLVAGATKLQLWSCFSDNPNQKFSLFDQLSLSFTLGLPGDPDLNQNTVLDAYFVKCPQSIPCASTATNCWPIETNIWYYKILYVDGFKLRRVDAQYAPALIDRNYASKFKSVSSQDSSICTTSSGDRNVPIPIVKCEDDKYYFLTNYIGQTLLSDWTPSYYSTGRRIQKFLVKDGAVINASPAILSSWGYHSGFTYATRNCQSVSLGSPNKADSFFVGSVLYCADRNEFYRVADSNNNLQQVNHLNIGNYVLAWRRGALALMNAFKSSPQSGCAFNSLGVRSGSCSLPNEVIYISNCATAGSASKPVRFLSVQRRSNNPPQENGQFYTCDNDPTAPKRMFQYVGSLNTLREIISENSAAWNDLLANAPSIADCSGYTGYSKRSYQKRLLLSTMNQVTTRVDFSSMRLACLTTCSLDGLELMKGTDCHTSTSHFSNMITADKTTLKSDCVRELMFTCSPSFSPELSLCGNLGQCTRLQRDLYKSQGRFDQLPLCRSTYDTLANTVTSSSTLSYQGVLKFCRPWSTSKDIQKCNQNAIYSLGDNFNYGTRTSNEFKNRLAELQTFLVSQETCPLDPIVSVSQSST